ncbi:MAG: hypothetical protein CYPHOPRED_004015 [Cyphobasidiales sp. Tagirdzhanova-0007]|nr:MAG: hypothetical protein CYPHOPRED_004015 [Cyphobasidiales sp. Tagirdzhanova-0007]
MAPPCAQTRRKSLKLRTFGEHPCQAIPLYSSNFHILYDATLHSISDAYQPPLDKTSSQTPFAFLNELDTLATSFANPSSPITKPEGTSEASSLAMLYSFVAAIGGIERSPRAPSIISSNYRFPARPLSDTFCMTEPHDRLEVGAGVAEAVEPQSHYFSPLASPVPLLTPRRASASQMQAGLLSPPRLQTAKTRAHKHACKQCSQSFTRAYDLKRHAAIHTTDKSFPCPCCSKKFIRKDALKRHIDVRGPYHDDYSRKAQPKKSRGGSQKSNSQIQDKLPPQPVPKIAAGTSQVDYGCASTFKESDFVPSIVERTSNTHTCTSSTPSCSTYSYKHSASSALSSPSFEQFFSPDSLIAYSECRAYCDLLGAF